MPLIIVARYRIKASETEKVHSLVSRIAVETRKEPGNEIYDYYIQPNDPTQLLLYERYKDEEAVAAHRETPHFQNMVIAQVVPCLESRLVDVFKV